MRSKGGWQTLGATPHRLGRMAGTLWVPGWWVFEGERGAEATAQQGDPGKVLRFQSPFGPAWSFPAGQPINFISIM